MPAIRRDSLMTLEAYARERSAFRARVIDHKRPRQIELGPSVMLHFEDELTIRYQIQEMLRAERIFEAAGIEEELDAYNPLVPDGANLKATMMLEYPDADERKHWLEQLIGIEDRVWMRVSGLEKVWAIADEDLDRETAEKTSSVHFLRFEFEPAMIAALRGGGDLEVGVDHPKYQASCRLPEASRNALVADFA